MRSADCDLGHPPVDQLSGYLSMCSAPKTAVSAGPPVHHVAVLISDMNSAGGIQRMAAQLVRDLQPACRTTLLSVEPLVHPVFRFPGLHFRSLDYHRVPRSGLLLLKDFVTVGRRLRAFVRAEQIDTVLAIWYDWASVAAFACPRHVRAIGWEHMAYSQANAVWRRIRAWSYPRLDAVVGLTMEDLPRLQRISRYACVIPNYAEEAAPREMVERKPILLTVSHLQHRKGIDRLLWAVKGPLRKHPDWKLVIVGGGETGRSDPEHVKYLAALTQLLGLERNVEFHAATERIGDWYDRASVYVMGSRQEGLPMVLIEAKARRLPIVSFDCPTGPKEIVRAGVDGFLIRNDTMEFALAVETLIENPELRRRMGEAGFEDFRMRFSRAQVMPRWHSLIECVHGEDVASKQSSLPAGNR